MGQYHYAANITKKEYIRPSVFGDGLKLMEFTSSGYGVMCALGVLLAISNGRGGGDFHAEDKLVGSWAGDQIAIVGDYWEADEAFERGIPNWGFMEKYYKDVSVDVMRMLIKDEYVRDVMLEQYVKYGFDFPADDLFTKDEIAKMNTKLEEQEKANV